MRYMPQDEADRILQSIARWDYPAFRIHDQPEEVIEELCGVIHSLACRIQQLESRSHSHGTEEQNNG